MPELNVPQDFVDQLAKGETTVPKQNGNSIASITGSNGLDTAEIYIGFVFDGYKKYTNISSTLPQLNFEFSPPPIIKRSGNVIQFDPNKDIIISIKVSSKSAIIYISIQAKLVGLFCQKIGL